jgi:hypothetical protein
MHSIDRVAKPSEMPHLAWTDLRTAPLVCCIEANGYPPSELRHLTSSLTEARPSVLRPERAVRVAVGGPQKSATQTTASLHAISIPSPSALAMARSGLSTGL